MDLQSRLKNYRSQLVGLKLAEAQDLARANEDFVVPVSINGEATVLPADINMQRVRVCLIDGCVQDVTGIG